MENLHYLPELERICKQSTTNKQGSAEPFSEEQAREIITNLADEQQEVYEYYDDLVGFGVAKEVARINTPISRYSRMFVKTDLWNWFAFLSLRHEPSAQLEIRKYARIISDIIKELFPRCHHLWEEHMRYAVRFSRTEHLVIRNFTELMTQAQMNDLSQLAIVQMGEKKAKVFLKKLITAKE
jgi:thymidylate synthase (FAD)